MIKDSDCNKIIELIINDQNLKLFLEIREKDYKIEKVNSIIYSKIYCEIKVGNKKGLIREKMNYNLYEWLMTDVSKNDINLIRDQIKIINTIIGKNKISRLDDIWVKRVNKGFPVIIKGTKIVHNGYIIKLINLGKRKISIEKLNKEIRKKNLRRLYDKNELELMFNNLVKLGIYDIEDEIILNNIDNELILRRIECNKISKLL